MVRIALLLFVLVICWSCQNQYRTDRQVDVVGSKELRNREDIDQTHLRIAKIREYYEKDSLEEVKENFQLDGYNSVSEFFYRRDTLFCNTGRGVKYYNDKHDCWGIFKTYSLLGKRKRFSYCPRECKKFKYPAGYCPSEGTSLVRVFDHWFLVYQTDEVGTFIGSEIIDTLNRQVIQLPGEHMTDFFIEDQCIWLGSDYGVSKVDRGTLERFDYYTLPAFKEIMSFHEADNIIYYLDAHYGLFSYRRDTEIVKPVSVFNDRFQNKGHRFVNSKLFGHRLFVIVDNSLVVYNIKDKSIEIYESDVTYLDSFLLYGENLVVYGAYNFLYDGGEDNDGGVVVFQMKDSHLVTLIDQPVLSMSVEAERLKVLCVRNSDLNYCRVGEYVFDEALELLVSEEGSLANGSYERDTKQGDTLFYNEKMCIRDVERFKCYSKLYSHQERTKRQRFSTSFLNALPIIKTQLKLERGVVRFYKY